MDSLGNVGHAVSVVGQWIFDSNNKKSLPLTIYSLNLICACSYGDEPFSVFLEAFYALRYVNPKTNRSVCRIDLISL